MLELLFNRELYEREINVLKNKVIKRKDLLDKSFISEGLTLRWVLYNQDLVISEIIDQLKKRKYQSPTAIERKVLIGDKERILYYFDWHEKILQGVISRVINQVLEPQFSDSLNSYRKGRGTFNTLLSISRYIQNLDYDSNVFIIKQDIKSYGDNIIHEKLFEVLSSKLGDDEYFIDLMKKIIQFRYKSYLDENILVKSKGLPTGSPINNQMSNLFLMDLDEKIDKYKDRSSYFRYGDDICVVSPDKEVIEDILKILNSFIDNAGLKFNDKGGVFSLNKVNNKKESFKYLGLNLQADGLISLTKEKEEDLKSELDSFILKVKIMLSRITKDKKERVESIIRALRFLLVDTKLYSFLCSYLPVVSDEDNWKKLDYWIAKRVLYHIYKKSGDPVFAKYPFKEMRKKGLISFRHMRRLLLSSDNTKFDKYLKKNKKQIIRFDTP
jgi:retron-type reverse transcriptase